MEIIQLDIGGKIFRTTKATLCSMEGYFSAMFNENSKWLDTNTLQPIFIDRDPETFPVILSYLRSHHFQIEEFKDLIFLQKLQIEADYYMLLELSHQIKIYFDNIEKELAKTEDYKENFIEKIIYKTVLSNEVDEYFLGGWEYISHYNDVETLGCIGMGGFRRPTSFDYQHNRCTVCGEAMVYDKFIKQHTSPYQPCKFVLKGSLVKSRALHDHEHESMMGDF